MAKDYRKANFELNVDVMIVKIKNQYLPNSEFPITESIQIEASVSIYQRYHRDSYRAES